MKKLLLALLLTSTVNAGSISTGDVRFPFISNGGFSGLCDRLEWVWGYDLEINSYACYSIDYINNNGIDHTRFIVPTGMQL